MWHLATTVQGIQYRLVIRSPTIVPQGIYSICIHKLFLYSTHSFIVYKGHTVLVQCFTYPLRVQITRRMVCSYTAHHSAVLIAPPCNRLWYGQRDLNLPSAVIQSCNCTCISSMQIDSTNTSAISFECKYDYHNDFKCLKYADICPSKYFIFSPVLCSTVRSIQYCRNSMN